MSVSKGLALVLVLVFQIESCLKVVESALSSDKLAKNFLISKSSDIYIEGVLA
ncbi:MAG TPA: hypothetical protein VJY36_03990 [Candidatus Bathyarchaeia archaeon]|nr:hypothetical protein [Candidatus Bathyarchaeia archaeon]